MSSISNRKADRAERAAQWAIRLADDTITPDQEMAFQQWLDSDPANGQAVEDILAAWATVEDYGATESMMELRQGAIAFARRQSRRGMFGMTRRASAAFAVAAAFILAVVVGGTSMLLRPNTYQTGIGERSLVVLPDGSQVSLDSNTLVEASFSSGRRKLWLERGRAKFDVAKDPLRPFSVQAGSEVVVATGTAFSVEKLGDEVNVVLYEGHVAVLDKNSGAPLPAISPAHVPVQVDHALTPGREAVIEDEAATEQTPKLVIMRHVDAARSLSWESGRLVFDDEPLSTAVQRMNRYTDKPIRIGDSRLGSLRISGVFEAGDVSAMVHGLTVEFGVRAREDASSITLYRPPTAPPPAQSAASA